MNTDTLSNEQLEKLQNSNMNSDNILRFVNKWYDQPDRPQHITDILIQLANMTSAQRRTVYVGFDEKLYSIKPNNLTRYRKYPHLGWVCTTKK